MGYKKLKSKSNKTSDEDSSDQSTTPVSSTKTGSVKKKKAKRPKTKKPKSEHYVNGKEFLERLTLYYKTDDLVDELSEIIVKIANGLSFAPNFINYSYKDEMVGDAVLKMFSALKNKKFNIESNNNPFSYFTTIAFHAFINRIKKEKKYRDTITKYQETVYDSTMSESGAPGSPVSTSSDNMFINDDSGS